jgi:hypothetical protein
MLASALHGNIPPDPVELIYQNKQMSVAMQTTPASTTLSTGDLLPFFSYLPAEQGPGCYQVVQAHHV